MVERVYEEYRDPTAVAKVNPHLHNVPLQIAAERGLPALAHLDLVCRHGGLGSVAQARDDAPPVPGGHRAWRRLPGMLSAGLFEHNFGDSEFLMLFLVLVTLPFAADRTDLP